jgi:polyferredoxin
MGLTRRRFLCLQYAYLTTLSIAISIFASLGISLAPAIRGVITDLGFRKNPRCPVNTWLFNFLFLSQMMVATLWGLYYLADRIHQPDSDISHDVDSGT